ncbi:MAG TPA: hypothetical protein VM764_09060 [Gemmatimonadaceae bacterium]|nr:hypothetical protein [Gemmatimonadaceae bacterium]
MRAALVSSLTLALAVAAAPSPASAQLGGLIKRGAGRAVDKAVDKSIDNKVKASTAPAPTFDDEVLELTTERIDQVVKGMKAFNKAQAAADVPGAMKAFEAADGRSQAFSNKYSEQRYEFEQKNRVIEECRDDAFSAQREKNDAEIERRMATLRNEPAKLQAISAKAMEWNPKLQAMLAKGDTAGAQSAMLQMQKEMAAIGGFAIDLDSAKVNTKCGKPAPRPSWLAEWERADAEAKVLAERVREAETAGQDEAVTASGLEGRQFHVARERIESFVNDGKMGFSKKEKEALGPRKAELKAYFPEG